MRRKRAMRRTTILCVLAACALAFAAADGAATEPATLVVDGDGVQCASADFTSIQAAVDAAQPGDLIRVCPDLYIESVVVDKPLTLKADPDAVEAIDCFQPTLGELPTDQQAIVDPAGEGFSIAFKLEADDVELAGFVVQGASVGIDASDSFSGYRLYQNLLRLNTLFAMDFGSEGTSESRVDHNCLRDNESAIASELDDDSLWKPSDGPERDEWNARDLRNARIDHNATFRNGGFFGALQVSGPGQRVRVTIDHNVSRQDLAAILFQNSTDSAIVDNDMTDNPGNSMVIGGGNERLVTAANRVSNSPRVGILFTEPFLDRFPIPNHGVVVTQNHVTGTFIGIDARPNNLADSLIAENTINNTASNGIFMQRNTGNVIRGNRTDNNFVSGVQVVNGATGNLVSDNQADNNGVAGVSATLGATGNRFEHNSMHGNGWRTDTMLPRADARDLNPLVNGMLQNVWIGNSCDTDIPAGMICGIG
jgi:parallel beta-helix repeat protein